MRPSELKVPLFLVSLLPVIYSWIYSGLRRPLVFALALTFAFFSQLLMNLEMDLKDKERGLRCFEAEPFLSVGPCYSKLSAKTQKIIRTISLAALLTTALLVLVITEEAILILFGALGVALMYAYLNKPIELYVRGLGEISTFFDFGPLLVLGSELAFSSTITMKALIASIGFGLIASSIRYSHHLPEEREGSMRKKLFPYVHTALLVLSSLALISPAKVLIGLAASIAASAYVIFGKLKAWADIAYLALFFVLLIV